MSLVLLESAGWLSADAPNGVAWWLGRQGWTVAGPWAQPWLAWADFQGRRQREAPFQLECNAPTPARALIPLQATTGVTVGAAWYLLITAPQAEQLLMGIATAAGVVAYVSLGADQRLRLGRRNTTTGARETLALSQPLPSGIWQYIELQAMAPGAPLPAGLELRLNGRTVTRWAGDPGGLNSPPPTTYTGVVLGGNDLGQAGTVTLGLRDLYITNTQGAPPNPISFLGPCLVETLFPTGDVSWVGWTTTASSRAGAVWDGRRLDAQGQIVAQAQAPNGDTSYIRSTTVGDLVQFTWPTLPADQPVVGVQLKAVAVAEAAGTQLAFMHDASDTGWTKTVPTDAYTPLQVPWGFVPNTGQVWRGLEVNQRPFGLRLHQGGPVRVTECCLQVATPYNPPHTRRPWVVQVNWSQVQTYEAWDQAYGEVLTEHLERVEIERDLAWPELQVDTATVTALDPQWLVVPGRQASPLGPLARYGVPARIWTSGPDGVALQFAGVIADYQIALDGPPWPVTLRLESPLRERLNQSVDIGTYHVGDVLLQRSGVDVFTYTGALPTLLDRVGITPRTYLLVYVGPRFVLEEEQFPPTTRWVIRFQQDWQGRGTFRSLLAELLRQAGLGAYIAPWPQTTDPFRVPGPGWQLVVVDPLGQSAAATWDWRQGALHPTPQVDFGGEVP